MRIIRRGWDRLPANPGVPRINQKLVYGESIVIPRLSGGIAGFGEKLPVTFKSKIYKLNKNLHGEDLNPLLPKLLNPVRRNVGKHSNHLDQQLEILIFKFKVGNSEALDAIPHSLRI